MKVLPEPLAPLNQYRQFLLYQLVNDGKKTQKIPINPHTCSRYPAGGDWQQDPGSTVDFATASIMADVMGDDYGVGFLFKPTDPFWFIDIDHCIDDQDVWSPVASQIYGALPGVAVEISQSGTGLHLFGSGTIPPGHTNKNIPLGVELYTQWRFVALTGRCLSGGSASASPRTDGVVAAYFPPRVVGDALGWTTAPTPTWHGPDDDNELIAKALKSSAGAASAFGGGATFRDLWEGNTDALATSYPDPSGDRPYDGSSADAALAQHLAFWTGRDCERMIRLMRQSALVRDKWDRESYLRMTIMGASERQTNVYNDGKVPMTDLLAPPPPGGGPQVVSGFQYMAADMQLRHFAGCVYIQDIHRVFVPTGALLKSEQFNATYGGFTFQIDDTGRKTSKLAWEAFTQSQVVRYPIAHTACFRPELPTATIIHEEDRVMVNTYVPITVRRIAGDAEPFLNHLRKLLPDDRDQLILLSYMAACVQYPGVKFQWAPLLQGTEGNGKTLFSRCVAYAVGTRYTHFPQAADLANKFNAWIAGKLFIGIEDVYVAEHKREVMEFLKPLITNDRLEIQAKGQDQYTGDNRANFMLNSNYKEAIRKHRDDRRFSIFFTGQQSIRDIYRDGMAGQYFPDLYDWLRADGYAIVAHYLINYPIPDEFNPAKGCHRAPETSSTGEAIRAGLGSIEQEIMEAIEQQRIGFAGGWISSIAVEKLLQGLHATRTIPQNKRRDLMKSIGYDWHPALENGRANNASPIDDGKKPVLFVKEDHPALLLKSGAEVLRGYLSAQGFTTL